MLKRILLALTFVAALGVASLTTTSKASAYGCGAGYGVGYGPSYGYYPNYYSTYYGYPGSAVVLRRPVYPVYYGGFGHHHHHHHGHSGVVVSFGF